MALQDRAELRTAETVPTLDDLIEQKAVGVFLLRDYEALTGWHRQLYAAGFVALEIGADDAPVAAYRLVTPVIEEPVAP